ncbi:MAG: alpha/beta fold hydrolase [Betaproteobacteria bacterium]
MKFGRPLIAGALVALLAACAAPTDTGTGRGTVEFSECRLKDVANTAWCGEVKVPENRADAGGRSIGIHVALLPAYVRNRAADPLVLLAGGPGQAASDIGKLALVFDAVRRARDIVLIDQRGTGKSHPFSCKLFDALDPVVAMMQVAPDADKLRQCVAAFDGDPKQYTTPAFIADLEAVRNALGVDKFNLWGGSYGSRVALAYLRAHPERIRSVIIDGVAPTSMRIIEEALLNGESRLAQTIADCAAATSCASAFAHLADDWAKLQRDYATGHPVAFVHPRTGARQTLQVDFLAIDGALRTLLYSAEYASMVPELIALAAAGDLAPLFAASLRVTGDMGQGMNIGLQLSVVCAEDANRISPALTAAAAAQPFTAKIFEQIQATCHEWPHGNVPADFHAATTSAVPVLVFSGGLDPVTPPANGELAAQSLKNATLVVAPGYAHLVSPFSCAPRVVARFIDDGNAEHLPAACLASLRGSRPPPFFVNRLEARP